MTERTERDLQADLAALVIDRAHDLTNLLGVARNYSSLAAMQLKEHPAAGDVATIKQAAEKALAIVAELTAAARAAATDQGSNRP